jgi:hypothetical protein
MTRVSLKKASYNRQASAKVTASSPTTFGFVAKRKKALLREPAKAQKVVV